jgi:hypothetical protein
MGHEAVSKRTGTSWDQDETHEAERRSSRRRLPRGAGALANPEIRPVTPGEYGEAMKLARAAAPKAVCRTKIKSRVSYQDKLSDTLDIGASGRIRALIGTFAGDQHFGRHRPIGDLSDAVCGIGAATPRGVSMAGKNCRTISIGIVASMTTVGAVQLGWMSSRQTIRTAGAVPSPPAIGSASRSSSHGERSSGAIRVRRSNSQKRAKRPTSWLCAMILLQIALTWGSGMPGQTSTSILRRHSSRYASFRSASVTPARA